jgi:hypothetical protein
MLVYGDHVETVDPREWLNGLGEQLSRVATMPAGLDRHAKLVSALIEAGQLLQGVTDAGARADALSGFLCALARAVLRSWDSEYGELGSLPRVPSVSLPDEVNIRQPEGFAYYAVYPEAYIEAARKLNLSGPPRVIGIRSIGTTLGAIVAAALDAPTPLTVRPFGHPFDRKVEPPDVIEADAHYVIADEGPGLSGSSFGAVADALEAAGVPRDRVAFVAGHNGDLGSQASAAHRRRWRQAQRVAAQLDTSFLQDRFGPIEEFSTSSFGERQKYRGTFEREPVLIKFAGLGRVGERKFAMARALHGAGFIPEPIGLTHGFLIERWCGDASELLREAKPLEEMAAYLGARARLFPASPSDGADPTLLLEMCRRNLSVALGDELLPALDVWPSRLCELSPRIARVRTDNRLDRDHWRRLPDGRLMKTDALDHHCAHDLIGCQDVAWDVAGGTVEFELDHREAERLAQATEDASGRQIDRELLDFYSIAYCCFRLGQASLASDEARMSRYRTAVLTMINNDYCCFHRPQSSVY